MRGRRWPTLGRVNARRCLVAAVLVVAAPLVSSCGVNFGAQTDQVYNPAAGVDDRSGPVDVLNALVVSGAKGSGTVSATLVNNVATRSDTLRRVAGSGSDASLQVATGGTTRIPADGLLNLATDGRVFARGSRVVPGNFVQLTFTFDHGTAVTVQAPVVSADDPTYAGIPLPSGS